MDAVAKAMGKTGDHCAGGIGGNMDEKRCRNCKHLDREEVGTDCAKCMTAMSEGYEAAFNPPYWEPVE